MKLKSFYKDQLYIISQSPHGSQQNGKAEDFGYAGYQDKNLYAWNKLKFKREWGSGVNGGCEYWVADAINTYIQLVHITAINKGEVSGGQVFAKATGDHGHIAININGQWALYLDYADRGASLYWWNYPNTIGKWAQWSTYQDLQLPTNLPTKSMRIKGQFRCTANNDVRNVRELPTTKSNVVGQIQPNTKWISTEIETYGENISETTCWYKYDKGWVSGSGVVSCEPIDDDIQCQTELAQVKTELAKFVPISNAYQKN